jgi:hypothetical protein
VTFGEVAGYVPGRAKEQFNEQNAVALRRRGDDGLVLSKVDPSAKPAPPPDEEPVVSRNPFGMPDVERPLGKDVADYAKATRVPGGKDDENAADWAEVVVPRQDSIDGNWSSRWKTSDGEWSTGLATVKTAGERVYIMYHDGSGRYLIEARRGVNGRLVGRYVNLSDDSDTSPWVGRVIAPDRIDGFWPSGRWDLQRGWAQ